MQGIHVELTEALKAAIHERFDPLLGHNSHIVRIHVRLHRDQKIGKANHYTATSQIEIGGPDIVASAEGQEAYVVLDELVTKLEHLLERRHGLRKDRRNHPHGIELDADLPKI